jgi:uncharacterized protein
MKEARHRVIYLHGFNSSPASQKARQFSEYCQSRGIEAVVPQLSHDPEQALQTIEACIETSGGLPALLVGSSLGGYYATALAERYRLKAALINPAVAPFLHLGAEFLGWQRNLYSGEEYEFTTVHVRALRRMHVEQISDPGRYLLLVQTGDEVLDYRHAVAYYQGSRQLVRDGGSHAFDNFASELPTLLQFADLE